MQMKGEWQFDIHAYIAVKNWSGFHQNVYNVYIGVCLFV